MVLASLVDDQLDEGVVDAVGAVEGPLEAGRHGAPGFVDELCPFWPVLVDLGAPRPSPGKTGGGYAARVW